MLVDKLRFLALRSLTYPLSFLPYSALHSLGKGLGIAAFYLMTNFRKRAQSNLAMAKDLSLTNTQVKTLAKQSFQNLMINCLEYEKFFKEKNIGQRAFCKNPDPALSLLKDGKGIIFFCGHQANWEILFLEGTSRMPGVAIGKPTKNPYLYRWVLSIREKFGGKIIVPQNAIKEGLRALKGGKFLGIVGDQGMPDSGFSCPFLGRQAFSSPIPAILSYRSGRPILVATTERIGLKYTICYSDPIWPNLSNSMEIEVPTLMKKALFHLEESIKKNPGQWLWQHNRWKTQLPGKLPKSLRHDTLYIIMPDNAELYRYIASGIATFRTIYPQEFIKVAVPAKFASSLPAIFDETLLLENIHEALDDDLRVRLVFDFADIRSASKHFLSRSAFTVITRSNIIQGSLEEPFKEKLLHFFSYAR